MASASPSTAAAAPRRWVPRGREQHARVFLRLGLCPGWLVGEREPNGPTCHTHQQQQQQQQPQQPQQQQLLLLQRAAPI
ncbi:hypothetical protein GTR04_7497 [Trichophyton interdigitale]|nr:hypothetical protein GY631_6432 [Trichophyton interdigitale]KAG5216534.1 hypothetical protein GY632_7460 [Trichophyton interdigitale]KAG8205120.1 hypothetical protein GTR04_7497 [Trichophyton interdigitale]